MANQELLDYVKQQLQQGTPKNQIINSLTTNGWAEPEINEAFALSNAENQPLKEENTLSQFQSYSQRPIKNHKPLIISICIISGLLIVGGGVFAYFNYFQSPERIFQKMLSTVSQIKSLEYSEEIIIEANISDDANALAGYSQAIQNKSTTTLSIGITGKLNIEKIENSNSLFALKISTDALTSEMSTIGLEMRTIGKIFYINFNELPNLGFIDLSMAKNQWVMIDGEELSKQFELDKQEEKLTPETIEKISVAVQKSNIFRITKKLASEKIEGQNTHHYGFIIDKQGIKNLFIDLNKILEDKELTEAELKDFDESLEAIKSMDGEIWIGKKDLLPYKLILTSTIDDDKKIKASGKITMITLLKNFNQPVEVSVPEGSISLEKFFEKLMGGIQIATSTELLIDSEAEIDTNLDTDGDGLSDYLEKHMYKTDPNNADTDGDGYSDGEEVENGYDPNGPGKLF